MSPLVKDIWDSIAAIPDAVALSEGQKKNWIVGLKHIA